MSGPTCWPGCVSRFCQVCGGKFMASGLGCGWSQRQPRTSPLAPGMTQQSARATDMLSKRATLEMRTRKLTDIPQSPRPLDPSLERPDTPFEGCSIPWAARLSGRPVFERNSALPPAATSSATLDYRTRGVRWKADPARGSVLI